MKLLQLNAWSCKLSPEITRLFQEEVPDFACMQEVVSSDFGGKILDTVEEILDAHPFADYYYTPLVEFAFMHRRASRGNMIASQQPIAKRRELWTHGSYTADFDYLDSGGYNVARNIAHATVTTDSGSLHLLTLHGYHVAEHKNGNEETMHACRMLRDYAASLDGAVIITGDFNLAPASESIQLLSEDFRNLSTEYKLMTTRNSLTTKTEVCDYIFVNDAVQVQDFYIPDAVVSDHTALILEFSL